MGGIQTMLLAPSSALGLLNNRRRRLRSIPVERREQ